MEKGKRKGKLYVQRRLSLKTMAAAKKKSVKSNHTSNSVQTKEITVMRKNQKVARVSLCCKLNMLVPQIQSLTARMQSEPGDKSRSNYTGSK